MGCGWGSRSLQRRYAAIDGAELAVLLPWHTDSHAIDVPYVGAASVRGSARRHGVVGPPVNSPALVASVDRSRPSDLLQRLSCSLDLDAGRSETTCSAFQISKRASSRSEVTAAPPWLGLCRCDVTYYRVDCLRFERT